MPNWLTIVIAVVGLLGTVLGVLGVSGYIGERAKYKAHKRNEQEDKAEEEIEEAKQKRLEDGIRAVVKEEIKAVDRKLETISAEITAIKEDLADNTVGTVTMLRDRMKAILDECRDAGYASTSTKANWHELYSTYGKLGGNHFREYVDAWREEIDALPSAAPIRATRAKKDK